MLARLSITASALAIAVALAAPAWADNLAWNGSFRGSLQYWQAADPTALSYEAGADADGLTSTGSARLANSDLDGMKSRAFGQCIDGITPGAGYFFEARIAYPTLETRTGSTNVFVAFHDGPGCTGGSFGHAGGSRYTSEGRGVWLPQRFGVEGGALVAGPNAKSAWIGVNLKKHEPHGGLSVLVDQVAFAPAGTVLCRGRVATIVGSDGPDTLVGTPGKDVIAALGGDDVIDAKGSNDVVCGGEGDDEIHGAGGTDLLFGDDGDDDIRGGPGDDTLVGGEGQDVLRGGAADDVLVGGPGEDECISDGTDTENPTQCELPAVP